MQPAAVIAFSGFNNIFQADLRTPRNQKKGGERPVVYEETSGIYPLCTLSNLRESSGPGVWIHTFVIKVLPGSAWGEEREANVSTTPLVSLDYCATIAKRTLLAGSSIQTRCAEYYNIISRRDIIHYTACLPRLLCYYSRKNSACWIVHSNQVCGVLQYYIKKRYHMRSRRNVVQMHGTIREHRTSLVNPTWTGHRMVCNLWHGVYYSSPHKHSDVLR